VVRRGELAALGLLESGIRLVDMAEIWAGVGDSDTAAICMPNQHAIMEGSLWTRLKAREVSMEPGFA